MAKSEKNNTFTENIYEALNQYGHIYGLVILAFIALATRIRGKENLITDSGAIALLGNDSWYHYRAVRYTIDNFPWTIGVDPKSGYPIGADAGTFGTLYDQIIATIALVLGLGNPSSELVREIMMYASPIFMVFVVFTTYYLAKYVSNSRWVGVASAGIVTFIPGTLYERTVVGFAQHHVLEVLFLLLAVIFTMKALNKAEEENITWELIRLQEWNNLKPWLKSIGIASFAILIYYFTWPPAMLYFGLLAMGAGIYSFITYSTETPTEPALLTFTSLLISSFVFVLIQVPTMEMSVVNPSILHVGVVSLSLLGTTTLLLYNRYAQQNNWSVTKFRAVSVGTGIFVASVFFIAQPSVFYSIIDNIIRMLGYPFGLGGEDIQTIAEEQSTSLLHLSFTQYGFLLGAAIIGMIMMVVGEIGKSFKSEKYASELFFVIVGIFFLVISVRTIRFNYYLAPFVAIFSVLTIKRIIHYVDVPDKKSDLEGYQIIAILLIFTLVLPILFAPVSGTVFGGPDRVNVNDYQDWEEPLIWMSESTESDNIPNDVSSKTQPYEYDEDTYGVLSWWDYGHWITVTGDRSPIANPFQQHANEASEFLLADNLEESEDVITNINENAESKYVAIDWQMISPFSKLTAIPQFNEDVDDSDLVNPFYISDGQTQRVSFFEKQQRYYESMMIRLYLGHGGQMEPGPYTIDYSTQTSQQQPNQVFRTIIPQQNPVTVHNSTEEAKEYSENNDDVLFNGFGANPPEKVEALENYRLVKSSPESSFRNPAVGREIQSILDASGEDIDIREFDSNPSAVKIFERVEGAEISGTNAESGEIVTATVNMIDSDTGLMFEYKQETQANNNGEFSLIVPYSTIGYDDVDYPPAVQSQGSYTVKGLESEKQQHVDIEESYIINENTDVTRIELEEIELENEGENEIDIDDLDIE